MRKYFAKCYYNSVVVFIHVRAFVQNREYLWALKGDYPTSDSTCFAKFDVTLILSSPTHLAICSERKFTSKSTFILKRSALVQIPGQLVLPHVLY